MELRKHPKHRVPRVELRIVSDLAHIRGQVAAREHHTLGLAARARGVEEHRELVGPAAHCTSDRRQASEPLRIEPQRGNPVGKTSGEVEHRSHGDAAIDARIAANMLHVGLGEQVVERHSHSPELPHGHRRSRKQTRCGQHDADRTCAGCALHRTRDVPREGLDLKGLPAAEVIHDHLPQGPEQESALDAQEQFHRSWGYDIGVHGRTLLRRSIAVIAGIATLAALSGCPNDSTAPTLASATSRYDSGQYAIALSESESIISRGSSADAPQAELVAGMAAFQLDQFDAAERHFVAAERSGAPGIRGRARVMLANIRLEQGRTDDAATLFESGAADLSGADADKARRYASLAREGQLGTGQARATSADAAVMARATDGRTPSPSPGNSSTAASAPAREAPAVGASTREPPTVRAPAPGVPPQPATQPPAQTATKVPPARTVTPSADGGTFTVRAGAYTTEAAARRRAKALAADVRRAKSPEPHIATVATKDGDTLYAVRIGTFRSRADAEAMLKRLARKDLAVGAI